jgi:hypothetical protein
MRVLRKGSKGKDVEDWQAFLRGQHHDEVIIDGAFGETTESATADFQKASGLTPDGVVGNQTYARAMALGFNLVTDTSTADDGPNWPPKPDFPPLVSTEERQALFGPLEFVSAPVSGNPEAIKITNGWDKTNIVMVKIPQLAGISGAPTDGKIAFHKNAKDQLVALFKAWEGAGKMPLVLSWAGSYVPRFVRGSRKVLSNHAFGTAFDINVPWNPLGAQPALKGQKGSTRELVQIANENGFYWGGHFSRPDGMHFEVAKLL